MGNGADRALRKSLILDVEATIESRSKILPGDRPRKLDELFVAQAFSQVRNLLIACCGRCVGQCRCVIDHFFFEVAERVARVRVRDVDQLIFRDAKISADGRADIQSEQASDH